MCASQAECTRVVCVPRHFLTGQLRLTGLTEYITKIYRFSSLLLLYIGRGGRRRGAARPPRPPVACRAVAVGGGRRRAAPSRGETRGEAPRPR